MARTYGSGKVTPAQRGHFQPQTQDQSWAVTWKDDPAPSVENAHDQQNAGIGYSGRVNTNAQHLTPAPEADR